MKKKKRNLFCMSIVFFLAFSVFLGQRTKTIRVQAGELVEGPYDTSTESLSEHQGNLVVVNQPF